MSKHCTYPSQPSQTPQVGCQRGRQQVVAIQTHTTAVNSVSATHSGLEAKLNYFPALLSWNNWINYLVIMFYFQLYSGVSGVGYPPSFHFSLLAKQTPCSYLQSLVCAEHIVPPSSVTSTPLVNNMWANNARSQHSTFNTFLPLSTPPTPDTGPFAARIIDTRFQCATDILIPINHFHFWVPQSCIKN